MSKRKSPIVMNFNVVQTHNKFDCEPLDGSDRHGMSRRVDLRIGYIITVFAQSPTGFNSVGDVVNRLNKLHKGAGYTYNDVYPTILRMKGVGLISQRASGWFLSEDARAKYSAITKNLRGK